MRPAGTGKVATFYIGAFWDEFLRKKCGRYDRGRGELWLHRCTLILRTRGAPVINIQCLVNKPGTPYSGLYKEIWETFHFNGDARKSLDG